MVVSAGISLVVTTGVAGTGVLQWHCREEKVSVLFKSHRRCVRPRQSFWVAFQEVSKRFENLCTLGKKMVVKVHHAENTLQLLDVLRGGALFDCGGLLRRGGGTFRRNRVAKKLQKGTAKTHFLKLMAKPLAAKTEKNFSKWAR